MYIRLLKKWRPVSFFPVVLILLTTSATAQAPETLPGSFLQDLELKTVPSDLLPDTRHQKQPEAEIEDTQQKPTPPQVAPSATEKRVLIQKIEIEGITYLDQQEVNQVIIPYENRENTFEDLQTLTEKLTEMYRERGYVTSRVYIPPQKLQDGILALKALEGRMGELEVKDGKFFKARSVRPGFILKSGDPFNIEKVKLSLRQLNENPDRNVRAVLKPGEKTGDTDVQLDITDRFPIHLGFSADNLGRRLIGDNRLGLRLTNNNTTGFADTLMSSLSFTRRSFGTINNYELPIGSRGTKIGLNHAFSSLELGEEFTAAQIKGSAATYGLYVTQSLKNREKYKLYTDLGFNFKQLDTNAGGLDFSRDQIRVLTGGLNFEEFDKSGRLFMRHEFGLGLDIFGATDGFSGSPSRVGAGSKFFKYTGTLQRTQRLPWATFGIFRVIGQVTPDRLVSAEQFQAGGAFTVRGYKEGQIGADNGLIASAEWRIPCYFLPKTWKVPFTNYVLRDNIQLISFLDYGMTVVNKPVIGQDRTEHILGTGFGIRANLTRLVSLRVDLGFRLLDQPGDDSGARIHFGLQSNVF